MDSQDAAVQNIIDSLLPDLREEIAKELLEDFELSFHKRLQELIADAKKRAAERIEERIMALHAEKLSQMQDLKSRVEEKQHGIEELRTELEERHIGAIEARLREQFAREKEALLKTVFEDISSTATIAQLETKIRDKIRAEQEIEREEEVSRKEKLLRLNLKRKFEADKQQLEAQYETKAQQNFAREMLRLDEERARIVQELGNKNASISNAEKERRELKSEAQRQQTHYQEVIQKLQQKLDHLVREKELNHQRRVEEGKRRREQQRLQQEEEFNRQAQEAEILKLQAQQRQKQLQEQLEIEKMKQLKQKQQQQQQLASVLPRQMPDQDNQRVLQVGSGQAAHQYFDNTQADSRNEIAKKLHFKEEQQQNDDDELFKLKYLGNNNNNNNNNNDDNDANVAQSYPGQYAAPYHSQPSVQKTITPQKEKKDNLQNSSPKFADFDPRSVPHLSDKKQSLSGEKQPQQQFQFIKEYNTKEIAENLVKRLTSQFQLSRFVKDKIMNQGQGLLAREVARSQQASPKKDGTDEKNARYQEFADGFDLSSHSLLSKYQSLVHRYHDKKQQQNQQTNSKQKTEKTNSPYQKLFLIRDSDKAQDKNFKLLRKTIYEILDWEQLFERKFHTLRLELEQRLEQQGGESINKLEHLYELQQKMDLSMKDRYEFVESLLKDLNNNRNQELQKKIQLELEYLTINQPNNIEQEIILKLQQRDQFRSQLDTLSNEFCYKYNKRAYQAIKSLDEQISQLLFVYRREHKYEDYLWRGVSVQDLLKIDKWEDQLVQREELRKEIRDKIHKKHMI